MDFNCKTGLVGNNISEVLNRCILECRSKPFKTMTDGIRSKLTVKSKDTRNKIEEAIWKITSTSAKRLEESKVCQILQSSTIKANFVESE